MNRDELEETMAWVKGTRPRQAAEPTISKMETVQSSYAEGYAKAIEDAAKVAEDHAPVVQCMSVEPVVAACVAIAAAIRALKEDI